MKVCPITPRVMPRPIAVEVTDALLPRKAPQDMVHVVSVPQTDTGRQGENPKALELSVVKELGKFAP